MATNDIRFTFSDGSQFTLPKDTIKDLANGMTVSSSTQSSISGKNFTPVTAGISSGTYTLKTLLQQLVNKSHGHTNGGAGISGYCSYCTYCDCDCDCWTSNDTDGA